MNNSKDLMNRHNDYIYEYSPEHRIDAKKKILGAFITHKK